MEKLLNFEKVYDLTEKVVDSNGVEHIVTIFAFVTYSKPKSEPYTMETKNSKLTILERAKKKVRTVKLTFTICHPDDIYNHETALKIARRRVKENPSSVVSTTDLVTSLKIDQITVLMLNELIKIKSNIDEIISEN